MELTRWLQRISSSSIGFNLRVASLSFVNVVLLTGINRVYRGAQ